ncbi:MAG: ATP-binding cassette domain-containing protein, partial [Burkholderiaceae bacterium]|nr:ATP-binding cassette domain-containing protein [Burkholderiaceae bacterium]
MLEAKNIQQFYSGSHILRDVSVSAQAGRVTVLLGRNGVGKTTLLKSLMGLVPIKSGEIRFDGKTITRATPFTRASMGIGYVPQGREIFPLLTVKENLETGYAGLKLGDRNIPAYIFELFPV